MQPHQTNRGFPQQSAPVVPNPTRSRRNAPQRNAQTQPQNLKIPLKPRWPYILGGLGALAFAGLLGFFMSDAAGDVTEDFVGYINSPATTQVLEAD